MKPPTSLVIFFWGDTWDSLARAWLISLECPALVEACPNEGFTAQLKAFDEELRIGGGGGWFFVQTDVPLEVSSLNG